MEEELTPMFTIDTEAEPTIGSEAATPATKWRPWVHRPRPCLYLDAVAGLGITSDGVPFSCAPHLALSELVVALPPAVEAVYLCGALPEAPQAATEDGQFYSAFHSWLLEAAPEQARLASGATHAQTLAPVAPTSG